MFSDEQYNILGIFKAEMEQGNNNPFERNINIRLCDMEEFNFEEIKKKIFPLILRKDLEIRELGEPDYNMSEPEFYEYLNDIDSKVEDLLKYDLNANCLKDIIKQMDFDIKDMYHIGDEDLVMSPDTDAALLVDKTGELLLINVYGTEVDVYLLSDPDLIIKFIDEFIQLLARNKKDKQKVFDYLELN